MSGTPAENFIRYLAAKKSVDDRALNRHVWEVMAGAVRSRQCRAPLRVLEVGCGSGAMLERLVDGRVLTRGTYTGIDLVPGNIAAARERWLAHEASGPILDAFLSVDFRVADLFDFASRTENRGSCDLLVAHAVLDLLDLDTALPLLFSSLEPGSLFYFTLNFDGATIFEPIIDPRLDALIETLYHQTMDNRRLQGKPAGDSRTGRRLFRHLRAAGATLRAAGSSDWVVAPVAGAYPDDEAYFLHFIIDTIRQALEGDPQLPDAALQNWVQTRHAQITARELIYLAHQLDFFGYI